MNGPFETNYRKLGDNLRCYMWNIWFNLGAGFPQKGASLVTGTEPCPWPPTNFALRRKVLQFPVIRKSKGDGTGCVERYVSLSYTSLEIFIAAGAEILHYVMGLFWTGGGGGGVGTLGEVESWMGGGWVTCSSEFCW
jgi:hypothetical protein